MSGLTFIDITVIRKSSPQTLLRKSCKFTPAPLRRLHKQHCIITRSSVGGLRELGNSLSFFPHFHPCWREQEVIIITVWNRIKEGDDNFCVVASWLTGIVSVGGVGKAIDNEGEDFEQ